MILYKKEDNFILSAQYRDPLMDHLSEKIFYFLGNGQGKRLLDVGCGAGRNSILAAKKGFVVTGVDIEKKVIILAKNFAERERESWCQMSIRKGRDFGYDQIQEKNF